MARFPEDEATLAKAEQLLRSLPHLTQPVSFEIVGLGPMPEYDGAKVQQLLQGHVRGQPLDARSAISGWNAPRIVTQFAGTLPDIRRLERLLLAHYPNSAVVLEEIGSDDPMGNVDVGTRGLRGEFGFAGRILPTPSHRDSDGPRSVGGAHLGDGSSGQRAVGGDTDSVSASLGAVGVAAADGLH